MNLLTGCRHASGAVLFGVVELRGLGPLCMLAAGSKQEAR